MKPLIMAGICISLWACNSTTTYEHTTGTMHENPDNQAIDSMLKKMYAADLEKADVLSDTILFSQQINMLNAQCNALTLADKEAIAKSKSPTDKPLLREGSAVTACYEGATDFRIDEIVRQDSLIKVKVTLWHKHYDTQQPWHEQVIFTRQNGLKIDNIFFDKTLYGTAADTPHLKQHLIAFLQQNNQ